MRKILVTGGAGAIGGRLVNALLEEPGAAVTVVDLLTSGRRTNVPRRAKFVRGDIADAALVRRLMRDQYDEIYHLAAFFANQNSCDHPLADFRANALGTVTILDAARNQKKLKSFLFASTSSLKGDLDAGFEKGFSTPYMTSKFVGELYCRYYQRVLDIPIRLVRYYNCYGPGEYPGKYRNVVINFIDRALRGEPLVITGDGSETRDFTFVDDIVSGTLAVSRSPKVLPCEIYHIGAGTQTSILDLARSINALTKNMAPIQFVPRRSWDKTLRREADFSLAKEHAGYSPAVNLKMGLERTMQWYKTIWKKRK